MESRNDARTVGSVLMAEYASLVTYSRRLTADGPDAPDLVQTVCARVLAQRTAIADVANVSAWLRAVLFRSFVDLRRRAGREIPTDSANLEPSLEPWEPEPATSLPTLEEVRALLARLPTHYRVPYELFSFERMPYARIAVVMGLSCKTVATRINRARARLRCLLGERYGG